MPPLTKKSLMKLLIDVGGEISTDHFNDDNEPITKDEAMIRLLWKKSLGYTEETTDDKGNTVTVTHKPEKWAIEMVAKARGIVSVEDTARPKKSAAQEVRAKAKNALNKFAIKDDKNAE